MPSSLVPPGRQSARRRPPGSGTRSPRKHEERGSNGQGIAVPHVYVGARLRRAKRPPRPQRLSLRSGDQTRASATRNPVDIHAARSASDSDSRGRRPGRSPVSQAGAATLVAHACRGLARLPPIDQIDTLHREPAGHDLVWVSVWPAGIGAARGDSDPRSRTAAVPEQRAPP